MRQNLRTLSILGAVFAVSALVGCTKEGGSTVDRSAPSGPSASGAFSTQCGTVIEGKLANPADAENGFRSPITVIGPNLVSVNLQNGPVLVKIQGLGISSDDSLASSARAKLVSLAREGDGIFIPADSACSTTVAGGGVGAIGQIFTASGKSYAETLISNGLSSVSSDPCGGSLLTSCYRALQEDAAAKFAGEVERLLWKPSSDSNGKLAIHTAPSGTTVIVNGETGVNQGGGNGYGSLARFSKPGCAYGANVRVQVKDRNGAAYTFNGSTTITIPTGCSRFCLDGSSLQQCIKR